MPAYLVKSANRKTCSIDSYVKDCGTIWTKDAQRPVFDIYYSVALHASKIGEALRRELYDVAWEELGNTSIWMLSLVNRLGTINKSNDKIFRLSKPLSDILWSKFPNCCPTCYGRWVLGEGSGSPNAWGGKKRKCDCMLSLAEVETRNQNTKDAQKRLQKRKLNAYAAKFRPIVNPRFGLETLEKRFEQIFEASIFAMNIETIGFHLLEEVGEVAEALTSLYTYKLRELRPSVRKKRVEDLENEIADCFSWLFAISIKLRQVFSLPDRAYVALMGASSPVAVHFQEKTWLYQAIWRKYGDDQRGHMRCKACNGDVCSCDIHLAYNSRDVNLLLRR